MFFLHLFGQFFLPSAIALQNKNKHNGGIFAGKLNKAARSRAKILRNATINSWPINFGFVKIRVYEILTEKSELKINDGEMEKHYRGRILSEKYNILTTFFDNKYHVEYKTFIDKFPAIIENVKSIGKRPPNIKTKLLTIFGFQNWETLL